jgi:hypothetical protein
MSKLLDKGQLTLTYDHKVIVDEIEGANSNKIIMDNIHWSLTLLDLL